MPLVPATFRCTLANPWPAGELPVMETELIEQGFELMLAGMGTVFIFLTVLVFATTAMSVAVRRFTPEPVPVGAVTEEEIAAISAAITEHRRRYK